MLKDILAISGQPGLYKMVSNTKNGIIVENLENGKRMPTYATAKVSALEDIAIYTEDGEDKPLGEVFKSIREKENAGAAISPKSSNDELKNYFEEVMPEYDKERVYVSDIKKVYQWYNTIQKLDMLDLLDVKDEEKEVKEDAKEEIKEAAKE
ncbi:MAG: DUF5606 domain-containing protein [Salinivirgaceae bacterium]|jgi:hypothetical protein|nr:DUF5606 domain-containing protein [Salinivirgaceae bacterium]